MCRLKFTVIPCFLILLRISLFNSSSICRVASALSSRMCRASTVSVRCTLQSPRFNSPSRFIVCCSSPTFVTKSMLSLSLIRRTRPLSISCHFCTSISNRSTVRMIVSILSTLSLAVCQIGFICVLSRSQSHSISCLTLIIRCVSPCSVAPAVADIIITITTVVMATGHLDRVFR